MKTEISEKTLLYGSSSNFIVKTLPILQVDHYVRAYGYSVSAKFDFTDVPVEYHEIMLRLILIGRCHVAPLATEEPKPNPPSRKWWHKFKRTLI